MTKTWTLADHDAMIAAMKSGTISADALKSGYLEWLASKDAIMAEINKMTVAQLKDIVGRWTWTTGLKKADLVERFYDRHNRMFAAASPYTTPLRGYTIEQLRNGERERDEAKDMLDMVNSTTDESLAEFAASYAATNAARDKALTNPQTRGEFVQFLQKHGYDALSDDQVEAMDAVMYEIAQVQVAEDRARAAKIDQIDIGEAEMEVKKDFHTQKQVAIWIVTLSQHVEKNKYKELADAAQKLGGHWSRWNGGFLFWREEDANTFAGVTDCDVSAEDRREHVRRWREEMAADRLEQYAMRREDKAMERLTRQRLVNTVRRARMAAGIEEDARAEIAMAATVVSVANVLALGDAGILSGVRFASDVVVLSSLLRNAQRDYARLHNIRYWAGEPLPEPGNAVIRAQKKMPLPWLDRWDAEQLLEKAKGKRGQASNISHMKSAMNDEGEIRCRNVGDSDAMLELVDAIRYDKTRVHSYATYKSLRRLGISSGHLYRHALRAIAPHVVAPQQADPVLKAERDLIGLDIPGYFPTPHCVADKMIDYACIPNGASVLEPSAGDGNIVERLLECVPSAQVTAIEIDYRLSEVISMKNRHNWHGQVALVRGDFIEMEPTPIYDAVLMNPPFEDGQDGDHVRHAYKMLKPRGVIIAIVGKGTMGNSLKKSIEFRQWLEDVGGERLEELPAGTFHESGTGVGAEMIRICK